MICGVVLEGCGDLLFSVGGQDGARVRAGGEQEGQRREHDRAREREPERQPERAGAEFTPAASLTRSSEIGDERVVVELRDEQPQAAARDDQRDRQPEPGVGARHDRRRGSRSRPPAAAKPARMMLAGRRFRRAPGEERDRRTCSATAARSRGRPAARCTRRPSAGRSAARSSCRRGRPAGAAGPRSQPEQHRAEQVGIDQRGLALALPADEPPGERRQRDDADRRAAGRRPRRPPARRGCPGRCRPCRGRTGRRRRGRFAVAGVRARPSRARCPTRTTRDDHGLAAGSATRHDRNVVMKPPSSGPTAAAIAAAAPTRA